VRSGIVPSVALGLESPKDTSPDPVATVGLRCARGKKRDEEDRMSFIQIIEYQTSRIDELDAALDGWLEATKGKRGATRGVQTKDRDAADTYVQIVEFPSYDEAMANSNLPETGEFAAKLASLCDGPPTFRNLEVLREEQM
jgi:hypothetical protein